MQNHALLSAAALLAGTVTLASCAEGYDQRVSTDQASAEDVAAVAPAATVKPGANVSFSHEFVRNTIVGGPQLVRLTIDEAYENGQLELEIVDHDGVSITQSRKTVINLAAADRHTWDLQFETPQEGRFYISILATIKDGGRTLAHRAYSIPIYIGDVSTFKREAEGLNVDQSSEGQPIVTMRAEETIEP